MEPQETIHDLSQALREVHAEDTLHLHITSRLAALRVLYQRQRNAFSDDQIVFLRHVKQIDVSLMTFIELREELEDACNVEDYCRLMAELRRIRDDLRGIAVVQRVRREIRGLNERLPQLQAHFRIVQQTQLRNRLRQIERNSPVCPNGHRTVIRESAYGYFWGCSRFPRCVYTQRLNREDQERLDRE
jgi:hypothetical protein